MCTGDTTLCGVAQGGHAGQRTYPAAFFGESFPCSVGDGRQSRTRLSAKEEGRNFDDYAGDFRSYYTQRLAKSGLGYEKYAPAFRFGHSLATNEPFRSQHWETIEPDVRRLWEEKNPGTWEQVKDAIRFSWERVRGAR